jgi:hypothetical protein
VRDAFFASLKQENNREKEAWVVLALGYLHHPLRLSTSEKYLPESLALLEEIQLTGDIFFRIPGCKLRLALTKRPLPLALFVRFCSSILAIIRSCGLKFCKPLMMYFERRNWFLFLTKYSNLG